MAILTPAARFDILIRDAIRLGSVTTSQARVARAIHDVTGVNDIVVLAAAARTLTVSPSQVRRLYGNGGLTYDLVNDALKGA